MFTLKKIIIVTFIGVTLNGCVVKEIVKTEDIRYERDITETNLDTNLGIHRGNIESLHHEVDDLKKEYLNAS